MRARRDNRGTTLIEAMVSIAVLATGVAGIAAAMVAVSGQDRRNSARAAAMTVANDTAQSLAKLPWNNVNLTPSNSYVGNVFGAPRVVSATQVPGPPPAATDTWFNANAELPTYGEIQAAAIAGLRSQAELNSNYPGKIYVFNRYWNVMTDPSNTCLKMIAVHVTYNAGSSTGGIKNRRVVSVYTSVFDEGCLADALTN
ncbi:MAG TPA: prepilin-type N-terminal cleavage/methylation domain-containing protein [Myxococcaceae bacterium]|nr:prepilin-type N-terminal cleavage/methylation domain-containing protein [Myxococcaceae bacterium]